MTPWSQKLVYYENEKLNGVLLRNFEVDLTRSSSHVSKVELYRSYNHAMFERLCLKTIHEIPTLKFMFSRIICQLSPLTNRQSQKIVLFA